ncbi:unnamed protein product [Enterobius vermicularis]|uniref:Acyl_transf_3 domain-containing protein n=1 Tax=Enterobius vermicularis TaxID=51028 RepID=A0A0N4VJV6_ENTVE|nr:unnamed protein product [Enterobius vermicularis]
MIADNEEVKDHVTGVSDKKVNSNKRRDIQGLRGLAIIYVLAFHLYPQLFPYGFLGVDIFFVISGYLITMTLLREKSFTLTSFLVFYKRRVKRIFPAYYLMLFFVLTFSYYLLAAGDYFTLQVDSLWALGFLTNIQEYLQNQNYFAEMSNYDFLLHTWSLAVEIQFYIIVPVLTMLLSIPFVGKILWSFFFAASLYCNVVTFGPLQNTPLLVAGLFSLSPIVFVLPLHTTFLRLTCTLGAAAVIYLGNEFTDKYILGNSYLYFIGEISYSVYLYHWPIIMFMMYNTRDNAMQIGGIVIKNNTFLLIYVVVKLLRSIFLINDCFSTH